MNTETLTEYGGFAPMVDEDGARPCVNAGMSDEDLLRCCARGQGEALQELVQRYQAPLQRFLGRLLGSTDDADDAVVDVFIKAWQHAGRFGFRAKVSTWLYRIALNLARDAHSRKQTHPESPWPNEREFAHMEAGSAEDDALGNLHRARMADVLNRGLARLAPLDRAVLVLYYVEDRDYPEIQAITGLSYTVLKTRLARARRRLKDVLDRGMGGGEDELSQV